MRFRASPAQALPPVRIPSLICLGLSAALFGTSFAGAPASVKLMSVAEIKPGMRGYGLSVFRGETPERFDIEVIDVLSHFRPDQDLVLIKTPHPLLDHAGSVAGMSGSPVYIDGRLIGAYAYGWAYGKDPIAGVTPIANMLKEIDRPLRPSPFPLSPPLPAAPLARRTNSVPHVRRDAFFALSRHRDRRTIVPSGFQPAATPLLVGGMSASVAELLRENLAPLGLSVLEAAGGGQSRNGKGEGQARYVDGGSIAVTLLRGDIQATAVGTVTHVDGKRILAFGHPMLDAGEARLPTATARVLHVMASQRTSFKMAEALVPLGALVHDRQSAIVVDTDVAAETIPVSIRIAGVPGLPRDTWQVQAASHRLLTSSLVLSALSSALSSAVNDMSEMTYRAESVVTLRGYGPQRTIDEGYAPLGVAQASSLSRLRTFDFIDLAFANPFEPVQVQKVEVTLNVSFGRDVTELVSAQLAEQEVDPGAAARIVLSLRAFGGEVEQRIVEVPLPSSYAGEQIDIEIIPASQAQLEQPVPQSFGDLLQIARSGLSAKSLAINVQRKGRGVSVASHVLKNLPASAVDLLSTTRDTARTPTFTTEERTVLPMGRIMVGQAKLSLEIRKEKR